MQANIFGIKRLNINTDGEGITTLVGMFECPLNCEYCINNPIQQYVKYTIEELYNIVKVDRLYFEHTGGGICFGGHEPLLQQKFIIEFIKYVRKQGHDWKFTIETSLNVKLDSELLLYVDYMIVDIKTIDTSIYQDYTETKNLQMLFNLKRLAKWGGKKTIVVPTIPGYTNEQEIKESLRALRQMGYKEEEIDASLTYITSKEQMS